MKHHNQQLRQASSRATAQTPAAKIVTWDNTAASLPQWEEVETRRPFLFMSTVFSDQKG